ncbi:hypothetical protein [Streptomyces sp. NPDC050988]|uniref:hypothetical protein n=1 Tax=Streptomyces sp. NPDC050988 TaxID=3365637 RepID=UPI0037B0492C
MIGGGGHLVDGVRGRAGPSRRRERADVREAAPEHAPIVGRRGLAATAPTRSDVTTVA